MAFSVALIICNHVLYEKDDVPTAIRISDVLVADILPDYPIEKQKVPIEVLMIVREISDTPSDRFLLQFFLTRPNSEIENLGDPIEGILRSWYAGSQRGFNVNLHLAITPRQPGTYFISVAVDGLEVARSPFTIFFEDPRRNAESPATPAAV